MASRSLGPGWWDLVRWGYLTLRREQQHYESERLWTLRRIQNGWRPSLERPIFVVGAPRSGTTFLGQCIAALSSVSYHFEPMATKSAAKYVYKETWEAEEAQKFYRFVYRSLLRWQFDGDLRFAEKTPRNCFLISFLHRTFPDAQFVHILRDGRDTALSHSKKSWLRAETESSLFSTGSYQFGAYPRFWVEEDQRHEFRSTSVFHRCIWAWRRHVEAALDGFTRVPEENQTQIRYERLVRFPQQEAERLLRFLQVDEDERGALYERVQKAHQNSVGNWRKELTPDQLSTVEREAGDLLRQLGYGVDESKTRS